MVEIIGEAGITEEIGESPQGTEPLGPEILTLEQILDKYPPKEEIFSGDYNGNPRKPYIVRAFVSRNLAGTLLYVEHSEWVQKPDS